MTLIKALKLFKDFRQYITGIEYMDSDKDGFILSLHIAKDEDTYTIARIYLYDVGLVQYYDVHTFKYDDEFDGHLTLEAITVLRNIASVWLNRK